MTSAAYFPPYRDLTEPEIGRYRAEGVVHAPDCVDPSWLPRLGALIEGQMATPSARAGDSSPGAARNRSFSDRYFWPHHAGFRQFAFESGLAGLAGQAMGSQTVRLYFDHVFVKEPETTLGTPWHQDLPYWPFRGTRICTVWLAVTAVDRASSGLEFVRGSHGWGRWFRPRVLSSRAAWIGSSDEEEIPDFDVEREHYEMLSFDMAAGDALIFSAAIVHGAGGNPSTTRRRLAFATRWLGDDVRWDPRPGTDPIVGPDDVSCPPGAPAVDDRRFPVVWRA